MEAVSSRGARQEARTPAHPTQVQKMSVKYHGCWLHRSFVEIAKGLRSIYYRKTRLNIPKWGIQRRGTLICATVIRGCNAPLSLRGAGMVVSKRFSKGRRTLGQRRRAGDPVFPHHEGRFYFIK